jgi:hypothetical protein
MVWTNSRSFADKLIKIFSDNQVLPSEWKYAIPLFIAQSPLPVVINAKNFADGMQHNIELYGVDIPPQKLAQEPYSKDYLLD